MTWTRVLLGTATVSLIACGRSVTAAEHPCAVHDVPMTIRNAAGDSVGTIVIRVGCA